MISTESVNKFTVAEPTNSWGQKLQLALIAGPDDFKRQTGIEETRELWPALPAPDIEPEQDSVYILSGINNSNFYKLTKSINQTALTALFSNDITGIIAQGGLMHGNELIKHTTKSKCGPLYIHRPTSRATNHG